jgi:hypothetical protein
MSFHGIPVHGMSIHGTSIHGTSLHGMHLIHVCSWNLFGHGMTFMKERKMALLATYPDLT